MIWKQSVAAAGGTQALAAHWQHKANNNSSQSRMAEFHSPRPRGLCLSFAKKAGGRQKPCWQSCLFSGRCKQTLHSRWLLVCFFFAYLPGFIQLPQLSLMNWTTAKIGLLKTRTRYKFHAGGVSVRISSSSPLSMRLKRSAVCEWAACRRGCNGRVTIQSHSILSFQSSVCTVFYQCTCRWLKE